MLSVVQLASTVVIKYPHLDALCGLVKLRRLAVVSVTEVYGVAIVDNLSARVRSNDYELAFESCSLIAIAQ